ncbi:MAG TPA: glycosyltransferase family 39 protein, partial [Thermoanaerobaculia bacterium]|nr:glycosyltransferase family 39 protein [Thermoanaerobaculia bacterium]
MDSASVPDRRARGRLGFWRRPWAASLLLAVLASVVFLLRLGSPPLTSPNEGLYAEVAREMNATGDFVIPRANTVVYLEKPPLLYWGTALSMRVFGENAFAARLPSALAAIATVLLVGAAGRRLFGARAGILSGIVLATSLGFALVARQVLFDSLLTLWTTLALLGFWIGTEPANDPRSRRRWLLAGYAALGLGVLTKGLVSIAIPALVAIVYALAARDGARVRRAWSGSGAVLFIAVAVPWHVIASLRQKQFAWFYLVNEHWLRFLGRREPADFHADPIFAPAAAVFLLPLPWSIFLPAAFAAELRNRKPPREILFLLSWILAPVVFFTLSRTRTYYYLLPAVPAVALGLGRFWSKLSERDAGSHSRWLFWTAIFAGLVAWDLWILAGAGFGSTLREAVMAQIWFASGLWLVAGFAAAVGLILVRRPAAALAAIGAGFVFAFVAAARFVAAGGAGILHSEKDTADLIREWAFPDAAVAVEGKFENHSSFGFYLPRRFQPVLVVDALGQGDLAFGSRLMADTKPIFVSTNPMMFDFAASRPIFYLTKSPSRLNVPPWLRVIACDDETMLWTNEGVSIPYPLPRP